MRFEAVYEGWQEKRQTVDRLARDGRLSPQQGRGTFVTGQPAQDQ